MEKCPICNKCFSRRSSLNRHLVTIHNEKPTLKSDEDTNKYNFIFYMHTCTVNNKRYVGATTQKSIKARWKNGNGYGFNKELSQDIKKYGNECFIHTELSKVTCTVSEAKNIEEHYIKTLKPEYNKHICGIKIISPNATNAMKIKMKNDIEWSREKVKDCLRWQKEHPEEMKLIHKKRIEAAAAKKRRKVVCMETGIIYNSIVQASKETNSCSSKISECCSGKREKTNNLHWKYYEDIRIEVPTTCPSCGEELVIEKLYNTEVLKCNNTNCPSKILYKLNHFIGKNGLDIDSLSVKTLEKLIELGWLSSLSDIFMLKNHREEWVELDGFKEHSVDKILNQIPEEIELWKILASLGIPDVNKSMAKKIVEYFNNEEECIDALLNQDDFSKINGIGKVLADNIKQFDYTEFKDILKHVNIKKKKSTEGKLNNLNFCITGSLNYFKNRDELVKVIEDNGGKITGVSKKLNYLINNDSTSTSSKNKKANELNIPIITEEEFLDLFDLK